MLATSSQSSRGDGLPTALPARILILGGTSLGDLNVPPSSNRYWADPTSGACQQNVFSSPLPPTIKLLFPASIALKGRRGLAAMRRALGRTPQRRLAKARISPYLRLLWQPPPQQSWALQHQPTKYCSARTVLPAPCAHVCGTPQRIASACRQCLPLVTTAPRAWRRCL